MPEFIDTADPWTLTCVVPVILLAVRDLKLTWNLTAEMCHKKETALIERFQIQTLILVGRTGLEPVTP